MISPVGLPRTYKHRPIPISIYPIAISFSSFIICMVAGVFDLFFFFKFAFTELFSFFPYHSCYIGNVGTPFHGEGKCVTGVVFTINVSHLPS